MKLHQVLLKELGVEIEVGDLCDNKRELTKGPPVFCSSTTNLGRTRAVAIEQIQVP